MSSRRMSFVFERLARPAAILIGAALLAGCTIVVISGPSTVTVGEIVTYVVEVGSDSGGNDDVTLFVVADVPAGWDLMSSTFDGTVDGVPMSGSGTLGATTICDSAAGDVPPGFQRLVIAAGPFAATTGSDTGTVALEFDVVSQPAGQFQIFFRFTATGNQPAATCSTPAVRTINRESLPFLSFVQALFDDAGGVDGLDFANSVTLSPDGRDVLVTAESDNSVAVFARDQGSGELAFTQVLANGFGADGIVDASSVAVSPDGLHAYVAGPALDSIALFTRDPGTGELTFVETLVDGNGGVDGLDGVDSVIVSPQGDSVYTASSTADSVAVFVRDAATGALSFVEALFDGVDGVDGLDGVQSIALGPDELRLYAVSSIDRSLAMFDRAPATGSLSFVLALFDGVDGLAGVRSLAIPVDGRHLYTKTSSFPDSVGVFALGPVTGEPSFVEVQSQGIEGVIGLENGSAVAVSPTGDHVFATGENSIVVFERDLTTGELTLLEAQFDGDPPNTGLDGASAVAVAPDGGHLYLTSFRADALVGFELGRLFADGFETGDTSRWSTTSE